MASETELLGLALKAYEAATEPSLWPDFLKCYTEAVSANGAFLQTHDLAERTSVIHTGFGISSPLRQSYNEYYSKLNVWRDRGHALYSAGRVILDEEQCPRAVIERSEFYNDCLLRVGLAYSIGAVIAREGNYAPTLTALRGRRQGPFDERQREVAQFVLPYQTRAWTVHQRLELLAAGESVLDNCPNGLVFLAPGGVVVYANQAAVEILRAGDGLSQRNGQLCALDRTADGRLRKAVDHALSPNGRPPGRTGVQIPRASLRRAYRVVAAPLRNRFRQFVGMPCPMAVVLISDPERQEAADESLLIQLYDLTPKEAALAAKLSEGKPIEHAAEELAIKYETARTHLRRIFSKTGTSRQSELLLLMARLPGARQNTNG